MSTPRTIPVTIDADRRASAPRGATIITENSDYTVEFIIEAGAGFDLTAPLTAVFSTARGSQEVTFNGSSAAVPVLCKADGSIVEIGVTQGEIKTTVGARAHIIRSVKSAGAAAAPVDPGTEPIVDEIADDDLIRVNDVSLGKWVRTAISTLAARVKALIGVFTGSGAGLVPSPGAEADSTDVLHSDATWGPAVNVAGTVTEEGSDPVSGAAVYAYVQSEIADAIEEEY